MRALLLVIALMGSLMTMPAMAGDAEIAVLRSVLADGPIDISLFSAAFLKAVPAEQIRAAVGPLKATIGPVAGIEPRGGQTYAIETATHEMLVDIVLDANGKIVGLLLHPPVAKTASIDDLLKQIEALAPKTAWLVTRDGTSLYSSNADLPLAVGSAFKLGVLKALKDDVASGRRKWSDVVTLSAADLSLPSGVIQSWPVGSVLTLDTLAAQMISISDNTATDLLLKTVGRDKVEAALGIAPVLTTRELFTLKANPDLKERYRSADLAGKRAILAQVDAMLPPDVSTALTPYDEGLEWEVGTSVLCRLIEDVGDLAVTRINPGVANKVDWASISYKGGSEIGVLNLTTLAQGKTGARYCASVTWNGTEPIDEGAASAAYAGLLNKLSKL